MTAACYKLRMNGAEPAIDQGIIHGRQVTWNPDDSRFYIENPDGTTAATFKDLRNAIQWCRTHKA